MFWSTRFERPDVLFRRSSEHTLEFNGQWIILFCSPNRICLPARKLRFCLISWKVDFQIHDRSRLKINIYPTALLYLSSRTFAVSTMFLHPSVSTLFPVVISGVHLFQSFRRLSRPFFQVFYHSLPASNVHARINSSHTALNHVYYHLFSRRPL